MDFPRNLSSLQEAVRGGAAFRYVFFWGHRKPSDGSVSRECFSQWYEAPFRIEEESYKTAEHYMMVRKARQFGDEETAKAILAASTPKEAKSLGRGVRGFSEPEWIAIREEIVFAGNVAKFSQNLALRSVLLDTGDAILVEASPVDAIWGIGLSQSDPRAGDATQWLGLNLLGFALTKVREHLREHDARIVRP